MDPSEWRDVCQQVGRAIQSRATASGGGFAKVLGVSVYDDGGDQVQPGHAEVLAFGCSIADFALPPDAQRVFECVMGFSFVQADLGTALHVRIEQPVDDEQCPFDPSDFT